MKTFQELMQESRNINTEIDNLHKFFTEEARTRYIAITGGRLFKNQELSEDQEKMLQELRQEEAEKSHKYQLLKVAQRVLFDNIRIAYFQETMPVILEVLKKYHNKPYGPVLKQKIRDDLKAKNINIWISCEPDYRSDELHISPVYHPYLFKNDELTAITCFEVDGADRVKLPMIGGTTGNRLQVYSFDRYTLQNCKCYVEDYMQEAETLLELYKSMKEHFDRLEAERRELNDRLPSRIDWIDFNKLHYNSLADHLA